MQAKLFISECTLKKKELHVLSEYNDISLNWIMHYIVFGPLCKVM